MRARGCPLDGPSRTGLVDERLLEVMGEGEVAAIVLGEGRLADDRDRSRCSRRRFRGRRDITRTGSSTNWGWHTCRMVASPDSADA
jgi:hypothetical protein